MQSRRLGNTRTPTSFRRSAWLVTLFNVSSVKDWKIELWFLKFLMQRLCAPLPRCCRLHRKRQQNVWISPSSCPPVVIVLKRQRLGSGVVDSELLKWDLFRKSIPHNSCKHNCYNSWGANSHLVHHSRECSLISLMWKSEYRSMDSEDFCKGRVNCFHMGWRGTLLDHLI